MTQARTSGRGRRLKRWLVKLAAVLVIALAAVVAALRLLFPWYVADPARVERLLAERLNAPVRVLGSEAQVHGASPVLHLRGLRVGEGDEALMLDEADLELDLAALVLPWRPVIADLRLSGLDIELRQTPEGLRVRGLPVPRVPFDALAWAERVGQLSLRGAKVRYRDEARGIDLSSDRVDGRLLRRAGRWQFGVRTQDGLRLAGSFERNAAQALQLWAGATDLALSDSTQRWFGMTPVAGTLDLDLRASRDQQGRWDLHGVLDASDLVYEGRAFELPDGAGLLAPRHRLPRLRIQAAALTDEAGLQVPRLTFAVGDQIGHGALATDHNGGRRFALESAALGPLADLAGATSLVSASMSAQLYHAQLDGVLQRASGWLGDTDWQVQARLQRMSLRSADPRAPSLDGLDLDVTVDRWSAVFAVTGEAVQVSWPLSLRAPVQINLDAGGSVRWPAGLTQLEVDRFAVGSGAAAAHGSLQLDLRLGQSPELDLQARVDGGDLLTAKNFWIINKMPPKAVEWLDRALVGGTVADGGIVFRGPLGKPHWPFREQQGRLDAWAQVTGATLDYHPDWPRAEQLDATIEFINDGAVVHAAKGWVAGAPLQASGALPQFREPVLTLDLKASADARVWLDFLRLSPVGLRFGSQLVGMQASGVIAATGKVVLPLKHTLGTASLEGRAVLDGMDFSDSKWLLDFRALRGTAAFSRQGFVATGLQVATPSGSTGRLDIAVGMTADPVQAVEAALTGTFSAQDLFGQHEALTPLMRHLHGRSDWQVELNVPSGSEGVSTLKAFSALAGTAIDLPAPLEKAADPRRNLTLSMEFPPEAGQPLELVIADSARARIRLPSSRQDFAGVLRLGPGAISAAVPAAGLVIEGSLLDDDPARWLDVVAGFTVGSGADAGLAGVDLTIPYNDGQAGHLRIQPQAGSDDWRISILNAMASGEILWAAGKGHPSLTADFQRLTVPKPTGGGRDLLRDILPAALPTLHVRAADFRVGDVQLGQLRLETFPTSDGLRVDLLESQSPQLSLRGSGTWALRAGLQHSAFNLRFSADDLGKMLSALGFAGPVSGGQTLATIAAAWDGTPTEFSLERLDGQLDVWVGRGRFLEVEPGAGRLFGLLSFTELPRRLALDFRDFFQSGMAFDEIRGVFTLAEGNAWTQNLVIKAPAAQILIIGRTGVAARDYDQQMTVTPKVGGVLPLVGALAGGPGGAAAGLLAQGLFSRDRAAFLREYRIGGTWEKPSILRQDVSRPRSDEGVTPPPG